MEKTSVFDMLSAVNCNEHIEKKNGLTYLPWAWAWHMVKKLFPNATFIIYENPDGWPYWTDGRYCWVKVGVIIEGIEHIEYLPIMDYKNNSIPWEKVTSMDVNKSIQRALTKACARHGLGLYIYAGEDLPEDVQPEPAPKSEKPAKTTKKAAPAPAPEKPAEPKKKCVITDENIKKVVDWVCEVPEGARRDARIKSAEENYEWPGNLLEAFRAMVDLTE